MIEPVRAAVRPRVRLQPSGEVVLLEEVIAEHLAAGYARAILLDGEVGAGKTTALQHLAHRFAGENELCLIDSYQPLNSPSDEFAGLILVNHGQSPPSHSAFLRYHLAGWCRDEWIEYLLAIHHDRCASVMRRIQADSKGCDLEGNPSLWRQVLNELASDEELSSIKGALRRVILKMFPDAEARLSFGWRAFLAMAPATQLVLCQSLKRG